MSDDLKTIALIMGIFVAVFVYIIALAKLAGGDADDLKNIALKMVIFVAAFVFIVIALGKLGAG